MNQVEQSAENPTRRQSVLIVWISSAVVIAIALGGGIWWLVGNIRQAQVSGSPEPILSTEDIPALYQEFECSCCGQDIGSCTCGMAIERQSSVNALVARGSTSSQLHQAMFTLYGEGIFFDQELAAQLHAELDASLPANRPILVPDPVQVDLDSVPIDGGPVSARYELRNDGETNLIITGLQTSCGCTTAILESDEGTSPVFGATAPDGAEVWSAVVPPGGQALLIATYDPMFHGDSGAGTFTRNISVLSNDPLNARYDLILTVEVTE
jgi:cytochrome c-type biogenesis protein CcmH/NrfF